MNSAVSLNIAQMLDLSVQYITSVVSISLQWR